MKEYHWSAWCHPGKDGILVLVPGGVIESDEPRHFVERRIQLLVAEKCKVDDIDDIKVTLDP